MTVKKCNRVEHRKRWRIWPWSVPRTAVRGGQILPSQRRPCSMNVRFLVAHREAAGRAPSSSIKTKGSAIHARRPALILSIPKSASVECGVLVRDFRRTLLLIPPELCHIAANTAVVSVRLVESQCDMLKSSSISRNSCRNQESGARRRVPAGSARIARKSEI
jgi:hypothetical protein